MMKSMNILDVTRSHGDIYRNVSFLSCICQWKNFSNVNKETKTMWIDYSFILLREKKLGKIINDGGAKREWGR